MKTKIKPKYPRLSLIQLIRAKQLAEKGRTNGQIIETLEIQVSYTHLSRAFKSKYGKTLSEFRGRIAPGRKSNAVQSH